MRYYIYKRGGKIVGHNAVSGALPPPAIEISAKEAEELGIYTPASFDYGPEDPSAGLERLREAKRQEVGEACTAAIYAGVDVGESHYSLTEHDQMELMAQLAAVKEGAVAVPYHADGELCRMYPAEEFMALAQAATAHVFCHRTYCNHLNAWIRRADPEELEGVAYGAELPEDLAEHMAGVLAEAEAEKNLTMEGGDDDV